jgi:hypothetical protein
MSRPLLALAVIALSACDQPAGVASSASAAPVTSVAPAAPSPAPAPAAAPPAPDDLDTASVLKNLKCGGDTKTGPCGVVARVSKCTAWEPIVPSGDGRWLGRGWSVDGAKTTDQITVVRARRVPMGEVGAGQIGAKVAIAELPKQEGPAYEQAERTIRAYERKDVPPKSSPTVEYVKQRADWPESFAMRTAGGQVYALTQNGTYMCQGPNHELLVVQRGATHGASADGLYAELWATSW